MSPFHTPVACAALAGLVVLASADPAGAARRNRGHVTHHNHRYNHLSHLHQALKDLQAAHHTARSNNGTTSRHLSAAIQQLELARGHHKTSGLGQARPGLAGGIAAGVHHHHHSHISQAINAAHTAQKQVGGGNYQKAVADIGKAEHHTRQAIASHRHL